MVDVHVPTRASVRKLLDAVLLTDADLSAFCLDRFPEVYKSFSGGMNRQDRLTSLLERNATEVVLGKLREEHPNAVRQYEKLLQYETQSESTSALTNTRDASPSHEQQPIPRIEHRMASERVRLPAEFLFDRLRWPEWNTTVILALISRAQPECTYALLSKDCKRQFGIRRSSFPHELIRILERLSSANLIRLQPAGKIEKTSLIFLSEQTEKARTLLQLSLTLSAVATHPDVILARPLVPINRTRPYRDITEEIGDEFDDYGQELHFDVFVVMPHGEKYNRLYNDYIIPTMEILNLSVGRARQTDSPSNTVGNIADGIANATLVLADCSERNESVYYEIGAAHALGRQVVYVARCSDDFPFDVQLIDHVIYEETKEGLLLFVERLAKVLSGYFKKKISSWREFALQALESKIESTQTEENLEFLVRIARSSSLKFVTPAQLIRL